MKSGEIMDDANSCTMCRRLIINAGISKVVISQKNDKYKSIDVRDWIYKDDVLNPEIGY
jgi:dCMP deaminase